jgi:hypothetical protein
MRCLGRFGRLGRSPLGWINSPAMTEGCRIWTLHGISFTENQSHSEGSTCYTKTVQG